MATTSTAGNTTSGAIKWTGMTSGIDFKSVVEALVSSERRVITRQQTWQSQWEEKLAAINNLDVRLGGLKSDAQGYDTREELLARKATSTDEKVATITQTTTPATGVFDVEVGENIVEKIASRTHDKAAGIGGGQRATNADNNLIDKDGKVIGAQNPAEQSIIDALEERLGITGITFNGTDYEDSGSVVVATWASGPGTITLAGDMTSFLHLSDANNNASRDEFVFTSNGKVLVTSDAAANGSYYQPLVIEMGGKKIVLEYDDGNVIQDGMGNWIQPAFDNNYELYHEDMTLDDLAHLINRAVAYQADPPDLSAEVVFDKTRGSETHCRLVITGGEGGQKNHIKVTDPTDLCLDRNSIDAPVTTSLVGSQFVPTIDSSSAYTGHVNKTITVMVSNFKDSNILGTNDVLFSWADTEGKSGTFVVKSSDWDHVGNCLKNPIELEQGVKIMLTGKGADSSQNLVFKNEAFTVDCQNPTLQKAADNGLAQTDKWVHQGVADMTSPVTSLGGQLVLSYGGAEYTFNIPANLGLSGMVERINSSSNNPGIIASVLNDGMGTATSYKLVLTGSREGAENGIRVVSSSGFNKMPLGEDTWTHAREASNSMCRVDGYPNDGTSWIQRPTNEVADVLDGVVLNLEGVGKTQITVQNNVSEMMDRIKLMLESVNFCKSYIKEQTKFSGAKLVSKVLEDGTFVRETENGLDVNGNMSTGSSGVMIGNYGFQIAQTTIDKLMTKPIFTREEYIAAIDPQKTKEGKYPVTVADEDRDGPSQQGLYEAYLEENGLAYMRLSDIGIASDPKNSGQYIVGEESKLREALTKNPEAVIKLFTFRPDEVKITYDPVWTDEDPRPRIGGLAVMMGYAMNDLTRTEDDLDRDGNLVKPGKGITKVLAENYAKIISGINDKISREEKRISMVKQRLEDKFTRLEVLLSSLNEQSTSLQNQLNQLSNNNNS